MYVMGTSLLELIILTILTARRCEMKDVMLEMDRILRPNGIVIVRDTPQFLDSANVLGKAMKWKCTRHDTENGADDSDGILVCKKSFWTISEDSVES